MQTEESANRVYAGFFARLAAYTIDLVIFGVLSGVVRFPVWMATLFTETPLTRPLLFKFTPWDIVVYLACAAYFVLMTWRTGATLGKRLLRLRVVSADGGKLTLWDVLYRETIGRYLSSILMIGYLMTGATREKTALHDRLCDTRVVYDWTADAPDFCVPLPAEEPASAAPFLNGSPDLFL